LSLAGFAADLPANLTEFMYASQGALAAKAFTTPLTQAAWKSRPSFGIATELKGSHAVYVSQPEAVAKVIEAAAGK
jgi:hypothetical protein